VGVSYQNPLVPPVCNKIIYILLVIFRRCKLGNDGQMYAMEKVVTWI